jgi:hypothetical protein
MKPKTHLHFNNHISSKQDVNKFARDLFDAITQSPGYLITFTIDDGDGDVWKYELVKDCERMEHITQIKEN